MGNGIDKILPGLYLGNIRGASSKKSLNEHGITHILAVFDKAEPVNNGRVYMCIKASDVTGQDLTQYFAQCNDFIHNARINNGRVLVHCVAGMSRSVTIVTAYIMTVTNLGWREALNAVRGARRTANPNFGFQRQLLAFNHDHLYQEQLRLWGRLPRGSADADQTECKRLMEIHRQWVLNGIGDDADLDNTYPLEHNAYSGEKSSSSKRQDTTDTTTSACSKGAAESKTLDSQANQVCDACESEMCEGKCPRCIQEQKDVERLISTAPETPTDTPGQDKPSLLPTPTTDCDELVESMFNQNIREHARSVCFNESVTISTVDKIDKQMTEKNYSSDKQESVTQVGSEKQDTQSPVLPVQDASDQCMSVEEIESNVIPMQQTSDQCMSIEDSGNDVTDQCMSIEEPPVPLQLAEQKPENDNNALVEVNDHIIQRIFESGRSPQCVRK